VQRFKIILVGLVFVLALLAFACAFTVRFTETAVVTRFGQAGEDAVKREAGLYFKLPYPFESMTKYDTLVRRSRPPTPSRSWWSRSRRGASTTR
jgi:regulator of protease activity HflC (stomatin/prohibitin superfamily)